MSKWIKINVPDDFDSESVNGFPVWKPVYKEVLDHGFVGLMDFMGDDNTVVQSARVSYGAGTKRSRTDENLLRYLYKHQHTTPFEMCEFMFHVKAPIFVFRQWHRHRMASINEMSARYSVLDNEMYMPSYDDAKPQATDNKQGRSGDLLTEQEYRAIDAAISSIFDNAYTTYEYLLGPQPMLDGEGRPVKDSNGQPVMRRGRPPEEIERRSLWVKDACMQAIRQARKEEQEWFANNPDSDRTPTNWNDSEMIEAKLKEFYAANELAVLDDDFPGLARELARMVLPVATYSQMYWKSDLKNLFHFIGLRSDPHAQKEIRVYSDAMLELIEPIVPWAVRAFTDYHLNGWRISRMEIEALREYVDHIETADGPTGFAEFMTATLKNKGCSQREITEFIKKLE